MAHVIEQLSGSCRWGVSPEAVVSHVFGTLTARLQKDDAYHRLPLDSPDFRQVLRQFVRHAERDIQRATASCGVGVPDPEAADTRLLDEHLVDERMELLIANCTGREKEILDTYLVVVKECSLADEGHVPRLVAERLGISENYVHQVLSRVRRRLTP